MGLYGAVDNVCKRASFQNREETQSQPYASKASVLVVPVPSLGKWEVCVRKGVRRKVCAKSNMQIRPAAKRTCNAGATVVFVSSLPVSF